MYVDFAGLNDLFSNTFYILNRFYILKAVSGFHLLINFFY